MGLVVERVFLRSPVIAALLVYGHCLLKPSFSKAAAHRFSFSRYFTVSSRDFLASS